MSSSQVLVDYLFPLLQLLFFGYHLICNEQSIGISTILFKYILLSVSDPNVFYLWFRHLFISQVWSLDYDILNYWGTVQRVLEGLLTFSVFWVYFILFFFFCLASFCGLCPFCECLCIVHSCLSLRVYIAFHEIKIENTEEAIKNGQSREIGNIGYTKRRKTKQKHNTTKHT